MKKNSYSYDDLITCGNGDLFGPGNAKLPLPPMLMFDRITEINENNGTFNKGSLKAELDIKDDLWFFDTNTSAHHHFFDEDTHELIDCDESDIDKINIRKNITGKKINSVEVLVRVASDNQTQK